MSRSVDVPCTVEIEQTAESLHAHAIPEGITLRPGDSVLVHGAPSRIGFGETLRMECSATVTRAGPVLQLWTQLTAFLELTELFEVGFQPKYSTGLQPRGHA
jgi:hypothetical protein